MLVFFSFELTIVVDSVNFSWDLGPCTLYFCTCVHLKLVLTCTCINCV